MNKELNQIIKHWDYIATSITYPKSTKDFDRLVKFSDDLLAIVRNNEHHSLIGLVDIINHYLELYESKQSTKHKKPSGLDALVYLMEAHSLHQSDLPEIGSQGVVSEILKGKRKLNLRHIKLLAKRFAVDPSTFIDIN